MKEPTIIRATVCAWLSSSYGPQDLKGDPQRVVSNAVLYEPHGGANGKKDWQANGYVLIGEADVTLRLIDKKVMVEQKVESLRAEQGRVLAEAHARSVSIEADIQKLLAIEYTPTEAASL